MQIIPKNVEFKHCAFWNEVKIYFEKTDIHKVAFSDLVKELISEHQVDENAIIEFSFKEVDVFNCNIQKNETFVHFFVKYLTINLKDLHSKSEEKQIRIVLEKLGYTDKHIRKIEFNSIDMYWHAYIHHDDFDYDPDEAYSERNFYNYLYNIFHFVLNFDLRIN